MTIVTKTFKEKFNRIFIHSIIYGLPLIALIYLYFYSNSFAPFLIPITSITYNSSLPISTPLREEKIKPYEKPCDYTKGRWVRDMRGPLYNGTTCSIIKSKQNCIVNGRSDTSYLNWRWKPDECNLSAFEPNIFLKLIKNMNIAFVGDSLANNQLESLVCLLSTVSKPHRIRHEGTDSTYYFASHNANLSLYWAPFLVKGDQRRKDGPPYNKIYLDQVNELWAKNIAQHDLIVLSFGHWMDVPSIYYEGDSVIGCFRCREFKLKYTDIGFYVAMRKALRITLNSIIERKVIKGNGIDVIVRTYSPTHFEGSWDKGGTCSKTGPYRTEEKKLKGIDAEIRRLEMEELENVKEKAKQNGLNLDLLDITNLSLLRPDGHAGAYWNSFPFAKGIPKKVQNDCVHWCLPGVVDTWNEIFFEMMKKGKSHLDIEK
ncbi:xyloglucan O-acetyltransferase 1 [Lathyrus oleraceus]|uniref:Trichome birefringence-like N-terminal domain-containing protein n=1 Tax=Pisum sativum TaxID=3888 RepID=A0A9D5BBV1_PEA|nr:xyloglucan O-acetyltransferase 1-like [Pisum sativum]KAI5437079.1 hypothetical protein KIW84_023267 [Pisum sativum]